VKTRSFIIRIFRAIKLDTDLYEEVKVDSKGGWQALLTLTLASLATTIGIGIAWGFRWAGAWYIWIILLGLIGSIIMWLALSFFAYVIGTRIFHRPSKTKTVTLRKSLNAIGFSTAPGLLGILICIPVAGGFVWSGVLMWVLVSGVLAVRHSLDLKITHTIVVFLVSWFLCILISTTVLVLSLACLVNGTITQRDSFDNSMNAIIKQHRFSISGWEITALSGELKQFIRGFSEGDDPVQTVMAYFSTTERQTNLDKIVEKILEDQIEEILRQEGISGFPPINFELGKLPDLLVVSPRDRITRIREIMLDPNLSLQQMEDIETRINGLDVSSLVVQLGGFGGVYPSYVTDGASLQSTINITVEEWVHQYLAFKPLGFRYLLDLLGISRNYEIAIMNETVAGIVSDEISAALIEKYYSEYTEPEEAVSSDFGSEMREIRLAVDDFLLRGEIEAAEEFMQDKRYDLAVQGFYIRKLNQAYFAWYGTYANEPGFTSPIGEDLIQLRAKSHSLKEFLDVVAGMTNRQDLNDCIE
jgi:hypothetical protein